MDMSMKNLNDADLDPFLAWFLQQKHVSRLPRMVFSQVNFSNYLLTELAPGLTENGVRKLLDMFRSEGCLVRKLDMHGNRIRSGRVIEELISRQARQGQPLELLGLSHNNLGIDSINGIVKAIIEAKSPDGKACYPINGSKPLWLRVEHNPYWSKQSEQLEVNLRESLSQMGISLRQAICVVTDAENSLCCPEACYKLKTPPPIHATFLFKHWGAQLLEGNGLAITKAHPAAGHVSLDSRNLKKMMREIQEQQALRCVPAEEETLQNLSLRSPSLLSTTSTDKLSSRPLKVVPQEFSADLRDLAQFPSLTTLGEGQTQASMLPGADAPERLETLALLCTLNEYLVKWLGQGSSHRNAHEGRHGCDLEAVSENKSVLTRKKLSRKARRSAAAAKSGDDCFSAPTVMVDQSRCLPLSARLLSDRLSPLPSLELGSRLWGKGVSLPVTITSQTHRDAVDTDFVRITYMLHDLAYDVTLTSSHPVKVKAAPGHHRHGWLQKQAGEIQLGDLLSTARGVMAAVVDVEAYTATQEVVEIALSEKSATCFVSTVTAETNLDAFVEVFGKPASDTSFVEILCFKWRPQNFLDLLMNCPELEGCRSDLAAIYVSFDLKAANLGPGKMFVSPELAPGALSALFLRAESGQPLTASDVVVDAKFKPIVCGLMEKHGRRRQRVGITVLPISVKPFRSCFFDGLSTDEQPQESSYAHTTPSAYARHACRSPRSKISRFQHLVGEV